MTSHLDCQTAVTRLWPFLEGTLSPAHHRAVQHHLASCPACCEELRSVRATLVLLKTGPPPALSPAVRQRLKRTIDQLAVHPAPPPASQRGHRVCARRW